MDAITQRSIIAVRFHNGRAIPLDQVFAYADAYHSNDGYARPEGVIWEDGFEGYAKGWWLDGKLCRVGAGAYGPLLVVDREAELNAAYHAAQVAAAERRAYGRPEAEGPVS